MPAQYSAPAWGQSPFIDLDVPSGGHVQVKRLGVEDLIKADLVDEFDTISGVADEKVVGPAKGRRPQDRAKKKPTKAETAAKESASAKAFLSGDNLSVISSLMGRLLPIVILQPSVATTYMKDEGGKWCIIPVEDREEGIIYIDTVPFQDQMAILQASMEGMDMEGLEQFREQREPDLGGVDSQPAAADSPL